tara:strand:- start:1215 stop:2882 length:1668 start_codon:yes stop_codon:yes gene_type:complete
MLTKDVKQLDSNIIQELECLETKDDTTNPMYHYIFEPNTDFSKTLLKHWCTNYTTHKQFLNDSIYLYTHYNPKTPLILDDSIQETWKEIKNDEGFVQKYQYIDWDHLLFLNESPIAMFYLSASTIMSPILSLITPILILFLPFLMLRMKNIPITMNKYIETLKTLMQRHAVGALLTKFSTSNLKEKVSLIGSLGFFIYSMYQNVLICSRFIFYFKKIHGHIKTLKQYLTKIKIHMLELDKSTKQLISYKPFRVTMEKRMIDIDELIMALDTVKPLSYSITNILEIGVVMKEFYMLHTSEKYHKTMLYAFGMNGYLQCIYALTKNSKLHYCKLTKKQTSMKNAYYPSLKNNACVIKNNIDLKKNFIITGPNASGKTTILKTTFLNLLFSQQIGGGFYDKAKINPIDQFYCYMNIPDTSGRDSLFQAEARQCKDILEQIAATPKDKSHFIIFDELYSGTNPFEASAAAYGYLKYMNNMKHVRFYLTTHFVDLCEKLDNEDKIVNKHMRTQTKDSGIQFTYKITSGISTIKGGMHVLQQLAYPSKITEEACKQLDACD